MTSMNGKLRKFGGVTERKGCRGKAMGERGGGVVVWCAPTASPWWGEEESLEPCQWPKHQLPSSGLYKTQISSSSKRIDVIEGGGGQEGGGGGDAVMTIVDINKARCVWRVCLLQQGVRRARMAIWTFPVFWRVSSRVTIDPACGGWPCTLTLVISASRDALV